MFNAHPDFKVGDRVLCCGGNSAIIIAINMSRVLVVRTTERGPDLIVGRYPIKYGGELVWDYGHYYVPYGDLTYDKLLAEAIADYLEG